MTFVIMMHQCSPGEYLAGAALALHADPSGVFQPHSAIMMVECSTGELLSRAAHMHHDDQGYDALMHHAVRVKYNMMPQSFMFIHVL